VRLLLTLLSVPSFFLLSLFFPTFISTHHVTLGLLSLRLSLLLSFLLSLLLSFLLSLLLSFLLSSSAFLSFLLTYYVPLIDYS